MARHHDSAAQCARFTRGFIGSPLNLAGCLIGSPIVSQRTWLQVSEDSPLPAPEDPEQIEKMEEIQRVHEKSLLQVEAKLGVLQRAQETALRQLNAKVPPIPPPPLRLADCRAACPASSISPATVPVV